MKSERTAATTSLFSRLSMGFGVAGMAMALVVFAPGCAADTQSDGTNEDVSATDDELSKAAANLIGSYGHAVEFSAPVFQGLVLQYDGTFFADIDTGIRCIKAPCPSTERLRGSFRATKTTLTLSPIPGGGGSDFFGKYTYSITKVGLRLTRSSNKSFLNTLPLGGPYCATADDCSGQGIIHPMCVGSFTCNSGNTCGYKCGVIPVNPPVWPADALQVTASVDGGFMRPGPDGSKCTLSHQKYTFTPATNTLQFETCADPGQGKPYVLVTGTAKPTAAELKAINTAAGAIEVSQGDMCGADKPFKTLTVKTSAGTKSYVDSFYSCQGGKAIYVDNLDEAISAFSSAAN